MHSTNLKLGDPTACSQEVNKFHQALANANKKSPFSDFISSITGCNSSLDFAVEQFIAAEGLAEKLGYNPNLHGFSSTARDLVERCLRPMGTARDIIIGDYSSMYEKDVEHIKIADELSERYGIEANIKPAYLGVIDRLHIEVRLIVSYERFFFHWYEKALRIADKAAKLNERYPIGADIGAFYRTITNGLFLDIREILIIKENEQHWHDEALEKADLIKEINAKYGAKADETEHLAYSQIVDSLLGEAVSISKGKFDLKQYDEACKNVSIAVRINNRYRLGKDSAVDSKYALVLTQISNGLVKGAEASQKQQHFKKLEEILKYASSILKEASEYAPLAVPMLRSLLQNAGV